MIFLITQRETEYNKKRVKIVGEKIWEEEFGGRVKNWIGGKGI
jgi:hypothetical protein